MKRLILKLWLRLRVRKYRADKVSEIFQDNAIQAIHWNGKLIIVCYHSIWELTDTCGGTEARRLCS